MATRESLFEVSVLGSADGQAVVNVLHLMGDLTGPAPPADYPLAAAADVVRLTWQAEVHPNTTIDYSAAFLIVRTIVGVQARTSATRTWTRKIYGEQFEFVMPARVPAARAGDPLPTSVAATVRMKTGLAGRSFRGGMRVGTLSEADTTFNGINAAYRTAFDADLQSMIGINSSVAPVALPFRYVIFGARRAVIQGQLVEPFRAFAPPLTFLSINGNLGTQVSRKRLRLTPGA